MPTIPVFDGHNDLAWRLREGAIEPCLREDLSGTGVHTDLARLRRGSVCAQFWSVYVPCGPSEQQSVVDVLEQIDFVHRIVASHPKDLLLARSADEVERAVSNGRIASLIGMEGGHAIASSLAVLRKLYDLGVRYLTLTHSTNTAWADSATDAPSVGGLSEFGHAVVRHMNDLGMLVDLSHVAVTTMHDALDTTRAPAFFSHSSARALCDHPRNVPDDVLVRVKDSNGLVMVTFVPMFLTEQCRAWGEQWRAFEGELAAPSGSPDWWESSGAWLTANPQPPCGVADVADHVEHVRDIAGIDAVGLGSDFDGTPFVPEGLRDVAGYPALFAELESRGWSETECAKLGWRNVLRVLRETEAAALCRPEWACGSV